MPRTIILDTFPLSSTAKQAPRPGAVLTVLDHCHLWIKDCIRAGNQIVAPAICYYEVLRELQRLNATNQISRLQMFCHFVPGRFLSITDADLDQAARLWAQARNSGTPTAGAESLDADVILAAQALNTGMPVSEFVIATTNPGHLSQFAPVQIWTSITP